MGVVIQGEHDAGLSQDGGRGSHDRPRLGLWQASIWQGKPFAGLANAPGVAFKCVGAGHPSHGGCKVMQAGAGRSKGRIVL